MKTRILTVLLIIAFFSLSACAGGPQNRSQAGAIQGSAGGALLGQAIGHNTESTLIGAAVGTMLGYMVGNEVDKYNYYTEQKDPTPATTLNANRKFGPPILLYDGRSNSSKRLGMLQSGDTKVEKLPIYDAYNNILGFLKKSSIFTDGHWTETSSEIMQ